MNEVTQSTQVEDWVVVLRPDGVVDSVDGGAPSTWLGRVLGDAPDAPEAVRRAARDVTRPTSRYVRRRVVNARHGDRLADVELLVVNALPIRHVYARIDELVMQTLDAFVAQARASKIELRVEQERDVPAALVLDREKIAWALATLVGNAMRYAQQGRAVLPRVRVRIRWDAEREELVVAVADNGPGVPPQQVRWLFERDPSTGRSAGLALVMVRDVVAAHHGSIDVKSTIDKGTTFTVRIPRAAE